MTRPAVVDASLVVDSIVPLRGRESGLAAMMGRELWSPGILDAEVGSAVARLERRGILTAHEANTAIDLLVTMPIERIAPEDLLAAAWPLRHGVRVADAFYVAAALAVEGDVLTRDGRLARAPGLPVPVTVIPR
ncbi:type II toxin-antitoxin system VapC family toxin [Gordonia iterans]